MKTLATALSKMLEGQAPTYYKRVYLYVRTWGGSAYAYGDAVEITDYLKAEDSITPIKWKLDREAYGAWTYSNCTLNFRNERGQFKEGNEDGFFASGTVIKNSKIRIVAGTISPDGTENPEYVFTGYISPDPIYNPDERSVAFTIYDHMALFDEVNAEDLSTLLEDQLLGSDSGTEFDTTTDKVGIVVEVKRGPTSGGVESASVLNPSTDYTVAGLNQVGPAATITLNEALTSGESLWATWRVWYENKEIHWIVAQLCDLAGISSTEISPVAFNEVESTATYDTRGQFETGTLDKIDTTSYEGSAVVSLIPTINKTFAAWGGGGLASNWTIYPHGSYYTTIYGVYETGEPAVYAPSSKATGTWDVEMRGDYFVCPFFYFLASNGYYPSAQGYMFGRARDDGKWKLWRMNGESGTIIWDSGCTYSWLRARIKRTAAGEFYIAIFDSNTGALVAGSLSAIAVTDNTYSTASAIITRYSLVGTTLVHYGYIKNIKYTADLATGSGPYELGGTWTSPEIDGTANLKNWGLLRISQNLPAGCSSVFETRERDEGGSWSDWTAVLPTGQINATKRLLQVRWTPSSNVDQALTPVLYSLIVPYYTTSTQITLVNMTGLTAKAALDQLSQLSCYEMGFNSSDTFIFRPRTTQVTAVKTLDKVNTERLSTLSTGAERVYNRVVVTFGDYRVVADPESEGDAVPTSQDKFGVRELAISSSSLLPAENVNLAKALAPTVYAYTSQAKRRVTVDTKFDLALELGDRVTVNFPQDDLFRLWRWGDGDVAYGQSNIQYYSASTIPGGMMLAGVDMRVEGIEFNLDSWRTRYDLVEVL